MPQCRSSLNRTLGGRNALRIRPPMDGFACVTQPRPTDERNDRQHPIAKIRNHPPQAER